MFFIEKLLQHPSLHVHTWHMEQMDRSRIRTALLDIRQLGITDIMLFANEDISRVVFEEVYICFIFVLPSFSITVNENEPHQTLFVSYLTFMQAFKLSMLSKYYSWIMPNQVSIAEHCDLYNIKRSNELLKM